MNDIYDRKLSIYLNTGVDSEGKDIVKAKTFSNVRLDRMIFMTVSYQFI